jgi:hypothetical protein
MLLTCYVLRPLEISSGVFKEQNASTFITGLCVKMDPLLLVLSCFYVELQYLNILKYLSTLIKFILKLLLFSISYPII